MANRDIIILNTTQSRAETQQASDTVRIKGGGEILSIENSSASPILTVQSSGSQTTLAGKITSTGNLTGVITGSFGRVEGTTLIGSAFELTDTDLPFTLSSSSQIASKITGSFRQGFEFTGTISGSGGNSTGSFDRIVTTTFVGDANNLGKSSEIPNTVSASSTIAADISGSFNKGFEFSSGNISGSAQSTGSFGTLIATTLVGSAANLTNTDKTGTITSSAQIASRISGSFNKGFEFDGEISASISSSVSLKTLTAHTLVGDGSALTDTIPTNTVSGSAQVADRISGSFNKGFEYTGTIEKKPNAWSTSGAMIDGRGSGAFTGTQNAAIYVGGRTVGGASYWYGTYADPPAATAFSEEYNGTNWSQATCFPLPAAQLAPSGPDPANKVGTGTQNASLFFGGDSEYQAPRSTGSAYTYNGTNFTQVAYMPERVSQHAGSGTQDSTISFGGVQRALASPYSTSNPANSHVYNGTNWTNEDALIVPRANIASSPNGTVNSTIAIGKGSTNVTTECWDGSSWSECSDMILQRVNLGGSGSPTCAIAIGGVESAGSPSPATSETWNGLTWSVGAALNRGGGSPTGAADAIRGAGSGTAAVAAGASNNPNDCTENYNEFINSGSFGQVKALQFVGNGANITDFPKPSNIHSGSAQFTGITGSFINGFEFVGTISGSATSTGSFSRLDATTFTGDGSNLTNTALDGTVSGSAQLASNISGSFNKGFEYSGEIRSAKGAWSVGASPANLRHAQGAAGVQTAMLAGGGAYPGTPGYGSHALSEEYNGSTWSETNDMITARAGVASAGTQNAALFATGDYTTHTEEYNGTSYATGGSANQARQRGGGAGTQTAGLAAGGYHPNNSGRLADTELYDGAAWSNTADLNTARAHLQGGGSQNASIMIAGYSYPHYPVGINCTELWNGTTWTEVSGQVGLPSFSFSGGGTVNAATKTGGKFPNPISVGKQTERWDGVTWAIDTDLPGNSRGQRSGGSTPSQHMTFGGENAGDGPANYEYNDYYTTGSFGRIETPDVQIVQDSQLVVSSSLQLPVFATNEGIVSSSAGQMWFNSTTRKLNFTIDVNSWSAGGALLIDRRGAANVGTTNAALSAGGFELGAAAATGSVEQYNGSTWSVAAKLIDEKAEGVGIGTQNSALIAAGIDDGAIQLVEFYNGTAWSEKANMIAAHGSGSAGAGTANAGLIIGGAPDIALSEEFNGTAWSESGDLIDARGYGASGGFQNSAWVAGGTANTVDSTEHYDGTSWSEVSDLITARTGLGGAGTQNAGLAFGGTFCNHTEEFNGTSWSEGNNLIQARTHLGQASAGNQSSALAIGGHTPSPAANTTLTCTEEYTVTHLKTIEIDGV